MEFGTRPMTDYWQAQQLQDQERQSVPPVRWICPFCGHELQDENSAHCGEIGHARPMTNDEADEDF